MIQLIDITNQHEIGFDIGCLPAWAKYVYKDDWMTNAWFYSDKEPGIGEQSGMIYHNGYHGPIPKDYHPKKFNGGDSLFSIDRSEIVNYNGTAI